MSDVLLRLSDVSVARGGVRVLSGITCDVAAGEALILRGPNGIGKTTLLRSVAGLQPVSHGTINCVPAAYAGHLDGLKSILTAHENLAFWADVHGGADVDAGLTAFGLEELSGRQVGTLSAGQKRRLGLARLLVTGRKLWLLDEPTVSIDREAVAEFAQVIAAHLASGGAAMIATHIDLGLHGREFDLRAFRTDAGTDDAFDEAFL